MSFSRSSVKVTTSNPNIVISLNSELLVNSQQQLEFTLGKGELIASPDE